MKYVVVDLEMNRIAGRYKDIRMVCEKEVIQIGAVMLDENYREIDYFSILVKPAYNDEISASVEKLTGICFSKLYDKPEFSEAVGQFFAWCLRAGDTVQMIQWSRSDYEQFVREMMIKDDRTNRKSILMSTPWVNIQKEYMEKIGLEKDPSLETALSYADIDFEGSAHDALNDARNTAVILRILRDEVSFQQHLKKTVEALHESKMEHTLGEMFDFSQFHFK